MHHTAWDFGTCTAVKQLRDGPSLGPCDAYDDCEVRRCGVYNVSNGWRFQNLSWRFVKLEKVEVAVAAKGHGKCNR